jgi:hypothetical protein
MGLLNAGDVRLGLGFRTFTSANLFGPEGESKNLGAYYLGENAQIVNTVNLFHLSAVYGLSERWSLAGGVPYMVADRYMPVFDANRSVVERYSNHTRAMGDFVLSLRGWLFNPSEAGRFNAQLGVGLKVPTGAANLQDVKRSYNAASNTVSTSYGTMHHSMQPGDSGWGLPVDLSLSYYATDALALYLEGSYLLNGKNTSGALTGSTNPLLREISVADQYGARAGVAYGISALPGLGVSLGLKLEGVPVKDLIGKSDGYRQPGYGTSIDPVVSYTWGKSLLMVNVPYYVYRRKMANTAELAEGKAPGISAFADYQVGVNFVHQL